MTFISILYFAPACAWLIFMLLVILVPKENLTEEQKDALNTAIKTSIMLSIVPGINIFIIFLFVKCVNKGRGI